MINLFIFILFWIVWWLIGYLFIFKIAILIINFIIKQGDNNINKLLNKIL
jgi:hypothetical protein